MGKRDFYSDPEAPAVNSLVVAVTVIVRNVDGEVLLIQRSDNGYWAAPGGAQDFGETVSQAAVREVREETGLDVHITGFSGVYSDPGHVIAYDDGEVRQEFALCLHASPVAGALRTSDESTRVEWVAPERLGELAIHPSMLRRITFAIEHADAVHID